MNRFIIGNPGTGKTAYLVNECQALIEAGEGVLFIDTHGSAIDTLLSQCPKRRTRDVLLIDPISYPVGWNILDDVAKENRPQYATLIRDTIKALSNYSIATPNMERVSFAAIAALLEYGGTILDVEPFLTDKAFRAKVLDKVKDEYVRSKWTYWDTFKDRDYTTLVSSTENKFGEFAEDPRIRRIVGSASTFDLKQLLFQKSIILLRLPEGPLGSKAYSFASLFLAHVQAIVYSRKIHIPLHIFIDDFHHFDTPVLRNFLSSGNRYGVSLTIANQYLGQLSDELRASVIGNCRRVMFQVGLEDSLFLHRIIPYDNTELKLHELGRFETLDEDLHFRRTDPPLKRGKRRKIVEAQSAREWGI